MQLAISVIIPVYNGAAFIEACVESVLKQTFYNIQVIVVDDGSTDRTLFLLNQLACKDERLQVIHQENGGVSKARNTGLSVAKGEWILFVDADDTIEDDYCKTMLEVAKILGVDGLIARPQQKDIQENYLIDDKKELIAACLSNDEVRFSYNIDAPWGKLFRRSVIEENRLRYPENLTRSEDAYFCMNFYHYAKKIGVLNQFGYIHTEREGSLCRSYTPNAPEVLNLILKENAAWVKKYYPEDVVLKKALWYRVLPGIVECERTYLFHQKNSLTLQKKLMVYQQMLSYSMIRNAIHELQIGDIDVKQYRIRLMLYKLRLGWLFALLKRN